MGKRPLLGLLRRRRNLFASLRLAHGPDPRARRAARDRGAARPQRPWAVLDVGQRSLGAALRPIRSTPVPAGGRRLRPRERLQLRQRWAGRCRRAPGLLHERRCTEPVQAAASLPRRPVRRLHERARVGALQRGAVRGNELRERVRRRGPPCGDRGVARGDVELPGQHRPLRPSRHDELLGAGRDTGDLEPPGNRRRPGPHVLAAADGTNGGDPGPRAAAPVELREASARRRARDRRPKSRGRVRSDDLRGHAGRPRASRGGHAPPQRDVGRRAVGVAGRLLVVGQLHRRRRGQEPLRAVVPAERATRATPARLPLGRGLGAARAGNGPDLRDRPDHGGRVELTEPRVRLGTRHAERVRDRSSAR